MDLKLNVSTWDLELVDNDLALIVDAEGDPAETAQRAKMEYQAQLGEYFMDLEFGFPWRQEVLLKDPSLDQIKARIRAVGVGIEGVVRVGDITLDLDKATRHLTGAVELHTDFGPVTIDIEI